MWINVLVTKTCIFLTITCSLNYNDNQLIIPSLVLILNLINRPALKQTYFSKLFLEWIFELGVASVF